MGVNVMKTKVIFRKWRNDPYTVIALFPEIPGTNDCHTCLSYEHIGQHGAASVDLTPYTELAKPDDYAELKRELESIGYNLQVIKKTNYQRALNKRIESINNIN